MFNYGDDAMFNTKTAITPNPATVVVLVPVSSKLPGGKLQVLKCAVVNPGNQSPDKELFLVNTYSSVNSQQLTDDERCDVCG